MAGISDKALNFGVPNNKFKYNGKEEQRQEFADGSGLEWLDYGARMYNDQIGRWMVVDPLADEYLNISPYSFSLNNAIRYYDPNGMDIVEVDGGVRFTGDDAISAFKLLSGKTKNVYVSIVGNKKDRDDINNPDKKTLYTNWAVFAVSSVELAAKALNSFDNKSINNLVLANHGASKSDQSWFDLYDEKVTTSKRAIGTEDIINYNTKNEKNLEGNEKAVRFFKQMGDKVADDGKFIFVFCYTGKGNTGEKTASALEDLFGNRFNVYLPMGYSAFKYRIWSTGKAISFSSDNGGPTNLSGPDMKGWLQASRSGITKVYGITVSTNAESAVKVIATRPKN
jgi:RHS repeat-associated protein